jgi:lysophospholipase L1-like esterase
MKKYILVISVVLNIAFCFYFITKHFYYSLGYAEAAKANSATKDSIISMSYNKYGYFDIKRSIYHLLPIEKTDVLFLGDSQTETFPLTEMFGSVRFKNRGISGSASADVLKTTNNTAIPNTTFLLVGTNDIQNHVPKDSTIKNISNLITLLKRKNPDVKIYVESVLPIQDAEKTKEIKELNAMIEALCKTKSVTFINAFPLFERGGRIAKELTVDGIHLSAKGYRILHDKLNEYVPKLTI